MSTAKVKILISSTLTSIDYVLLLENIKNVKIYGLYIKNDLVCPEGKECYYWQGIAVRDSRDIEIGAAGRGNVILGFRQNVGTNVPLEGGQIHYYIVNFTLKGNFIGIEPDGKTLSSIERGGVSLNYINGQFTVGGTPEEGNLLPEGLTIYQVNTENYTDPGSEMFVLPATIRIRNNKIGVDYTETVSFPSSFGLYIATHSPGGKNTIFIEDNIISAANARGISLQNNLYETNIRRNYIGIDRSLTKVMPIGDTGIFTYMSNNVKIGSNNPSDKNYIANCKPIGVWPYSTVSVNKNSFFCVKDIFPMIFDPGSTMDIPFVNIGKIAGSSISGNATPNAEIELFYADKCGTCAPETYFGSATADAAGNWKYDGVLQGTVIASSTFRGATSEFTKTTVDIENVKVTNTCPNYGSVTGALPFSFTDISWVDENGVVKGTEPDLLNVAPGKYKLKIGYGNCSAESPWYEVKLGLSVDASVIQTIDASCNAPNGSIKGLSIVNNIGSAVKYSWKDGAGNEVGTTLDLNNIKPGTYSLSVMAADNSCTLLYGPVILKNISGPNINETNLVVSASECGKAEGSIKGITANGTGVLRYEWKNEDGEAVSNTLDLSEKPSGSYTLHIFDESACGSILSSTISIPETNGISFNDIGTVKAASCGAANGSITGIQVSGALIYKWYNQANQLIATTSNPDLIGVTTGTYYLLAANSSCNKISKLYVVGGESAILINVENIQLTHDHCNLSVGTITGIGASGKLPLSYQWENDLGALFGTQRDLKNVPQGTYHLTIKDAADCSTKLTYQVLNMDQDIARPLVNDLQLCGSGDALLTVNNAIADSKYKLYGDEYDLNPIDEQQAGRFKINATENRNYYLSRRTGTCESPRTKVSVTVGYAALNIPNAFSPNNDGNNDFWNIKGIDIYPNVNIMVFNRYGVKVFESIKYHRPFDGNLNGTPVPAGVYYYVIQIGEGCSSISGSLTILR